ncbi:S-layer protein SlaA [Metallosphaera sp. D4-4]|uniref:S-layer protein SlaA n=1 Tax=Metallosphaera sp. D4-4 TaxID=3379815 RepID=UPI0039089B0A
MNKNAIRYLSLLLVFLMGGSFLAGITTFGQTSSTAGGVTISVSNQWVGNDTVVLVAIYNPNVPQNQYGAKYVAGNVTISAAGVTVPLISNDTSNASVVYYLNNGQHYFWFFITMTPVPTATASSLSMTKSLTINNTLTAVTLTNPYLSFTTQYTKIQTDGQNGVFQLTLPSSFPNQLCGEYGQTIYGGHKVNITDLYYFYQHYDAKTITISYSTGASVTINDYLADSSNYAATLQTTESTVPLNSTWPVYFVDNIMQADPLVGGNGGFMITVNGNQVSPVIQNVSYLAIKNGVYVNTTVFTNNPVPNAQAMFGYGKVYYGNFTMYTSSIVTNKTYATLLSGNNYYTPANVSFSQYKMLVTSGLFTTNTPITIYLSDWIGNNASVSVTGTIKETIPQPISLSVLKGENLTVNAFDNISNFSVNENIMVYVALQSITGSTYKTAMISLPETYAGSGVFSLPTVLRIGSSPSITYSSSQVTITLPPYDFSNTSLLITATNDIGASYYYLGTNVVKNISTPGTIVVETPISLVPIPNEKSIANVTPVIELAYNEPNLAFGTATALTVSGTSIEYNGVQVATDSVTAVLPNGTVISGNLNGLNINSLTSANGNGTFFIVVPSTVIKTFLGTHTYIPSGTELTFKIYDEFAAETLSVTYTFTTIAPVIAIKTPTSTSFSSAETAYLPPLPYNIVPEKHYISVNVTDTLYAQSIPSSALQTTVQIIVENPSGQQVGNMITTVVSETAANSGLFTGEIYYTVNEDSYGYWLFINGQNITNLKYVVNGGLIVFEYTSPSSQSTVNATVVLKPSPFTLSVSKNSANPGQYVNVSVNSPGLVESSNMKFTGSLIIYAQFAEWNGPGSQPTIAVSPITLKEVSAGSPIFGGTIVLGNSSVVSSGNLTSLISTSGYTVAPGSVVLVNANATIGPTSTSSSITPYYQQQSISINVVGVNVSILNPSPASPFAKLEIELQSPLFNLLKHPPAGNYTTAGSSAGILEGILSTVTTQQSQQLITSTQLVSSSTSFYYNNTIWIIETPMTLWSGIPGSYGVPIEVNLTDLLTVTHNVYTIHVVEVPNVTTGTVSLVSAYAVPSVSSNVAQLQINGLVPPVISVFFNGNNITQSASEAIPFPNTTAGELVNITVYAPDAVNNFNVPGSGTTFNVTIMNIANGETTTLTLTQMTKIISGVAVPTPYYTGLLKVVEPTVYTPGIPGEISASSGVVNKVEVNMNLVEGYYFNAQGLAQQLTMKANSYFYVGVIKLSVLVSHFTILSNGTPVTSMHVGKSYSLLFNVTNNGNVNETIYGTLEVLLNGTPVQPEIVAQITLAPGQSTQIGTLFTPTMAGNYTITFIPFQNNLLSIPYNQGLTEVVTAS